MFDKLEDLLIRYEEIMGELQEPDVANDQERFRKLMKEQADLAPIVEAYTEYKKAKQSIADSEEMLEIESDEEMRELAKEELSSSKKRVEELEHELKILLLPKDPNDDKNIMVEIRAGAGGDESALFAAEVYRMYVHYAESKRWKTEMISVNEMESVDLRKSYYGKWTGRLLSDEIRKWSTPCTACAGDRVRWTYPHIHNHCCGDAGSGGSGCCDRRERYSYRCNESIWKWWAVCQYNRLCSSSYTLSDRNCDLQPDREITASEQRESIPLTAFKTV